MEVDRNATAGHHVIKFHVDALREHVDIDGSTGQSSDDGLQLVGRVVGVLDLVSGLIGHAGEVAGAVVGVGLLLSVGVIGLDQPLAGVVKINICQVTKLR